jgi:hypothetical protein
MGKQEPNHRKIVAEYRVMDHEENGIVRPEVDVCSPRYHVFGYVGILANHRFHKSEA